MVSWISRVKEHFCGEQTLFDEPSQYDGAFSDKRVLLFLFLWLVLWTVWPTLCVGSTAIDVAENVAWGQNFDWGYDKNPYFGAWFSYAVFRIFPEGINEYAFYLMSQIAATLGVWAVYLLARDIFKSRFTAFLVVPLVLFVPYFSHSGYEFNDDMLSIPLYGLTGLFFYRGVRDNTAGNWLAAGLCAGLALMTKYLAGALLAPLGLLLLVTPEGRACWKKPGIYLGAALFCLLVLPNVIWIFTHDFIAIKYALMRANLTEAPGLKDHIFNLLAAWGQYLFRLPLAFAALFFLPRGKAREFPKFDRLFILAAALGPMILSSLFALLTGGKVRPAWMTPYFVFAPLFLIWLYRPVFERRQLKYLAALVILFVVGAMSLTVQEFLYWNPYRKNSCVHQVYPGKKLSAILTKSWREKFAVPCPYVIGGRRESCYMCYYSPDHPRAFFDHDRELSPWIDPEDLRKRGAVIIWRGSPPEYLKQYPDALPLPPISVERQIPAWVRTFAPAPKEDTYYAAFVPPASRKTTETAP